jgi:HEAT repeat protein
MLKRLTFDFILIQGLIRILSIRTTIRESVEASERDPDLAVRLGRRAIPRLVARLREPSSAARDHAAIALGTLGDGRAFEPLLQALAGERSAAAATALGRLGEPRAVEPLLGVLHHHSVWVRKCVAESLAELGDPRALEPLKLLRDRDENEHVRKAAARAVERFAASEQAMRPVAKAG